MGIEYHLKFDNPGPSRVAALLRSLPGAREKPPHPWFELGVTADPGDWPTATVQADPEGAYFVDNCGGGGPEQLGVVVAWLVGEFGPVTVTEL
ncbi:hypothetical protein J0H58_19515 [bacterium]|nr:hypothetical protein [bacterium]